MKKILTIVAITAATYASFGQGYFAVTGASKSVWDIFTTTLTPKLGATESVGIYIGTGTPAVEAIANGVVTNQATVYSSNPWSTILNDPNFHLAVNSNTVANVIIPTTTAGGGFTISGTFPINGSAIGANSLYVVAWDKNYATPALAAAANAAVGWSSVFTYQGQTSFGTTPSFAASGFVPFGVNAVVVPEPTTLALAGLSGASLLLFRRKK